MIDSTWSTPVLVKNGQNAEMSIGSAQRAAEFLVLHWPEVSRGSKQLAAEIACLDVLEGRQEPDHARKAFAEAAREAKILIE